jgi:hypothetical protein
MKGSHNRKEAKIHGTIGPEAPLNLKPMGVSISIFPIVTLNKADQKRGCRSCGRSEDGSVMLFSHTIAPIFGRRLSKNRFEKKKKEGRNRSLGQYR